MKKAIFFGVFGLTALLSRAAFAAGDTDPNPLQLQVTHAGPAQYQPGNPIELVVTIVASTNGTVTALGMTDAVPEGWSFVGARPISESLPAVMPQPGTTGQIEFAWITQPNFPYSFAYSLSVPPNTSGPATISGQVEYRTSGPRQLSNPDIITIAGPNNTPPKIQLNGGTTMQVEQGSPFQDPGYTATDTEDGDLTDKVNVSGNVDTSTPGEYALTYTVQDSGGKTASATRVVEVVASNNNNGGGTGNNGGTDGGTNGGTSGGNGGAGNRYVGGPYNGNANGKRGNTRNNTNAANAGANGLNASGLLNGQNKVDAETARRAMELASRQNKTAIPQIPGAIGPMPRPGAAGSTGPGKPSQTTLVKDLKHPEEDSDLKALDEGLFGENTGALTTDAATKPPADATKVASAATAPEMVKAATAPRVPGLIERAKMRINGLGKREIATLFASALVLVGLIGFATVAGRIAYAGPTRRKPNKPATAE